MPKPIKASGKVALSIKKEASFRSQIRKLPEGTRDLPVEVVNILNKKGSLTTHGEIPHAALKEIFETFTGNDEASAVMKNLCQQIQDKKYTFNSLAAAIQESIAAIRELPEKKAALSFLSKPNSAKKQALNTLLMVQNFNKLSKVENPLAAGLQKVSRLLRKDKNNEVNNELAEMVNESVRLILSSEEISQDLGALIDLQKIATSMMESDPTRKKVVEIIDQRIVELTPEVTKLKSKVSNTFNDTLAATLSHVQKRIKEAGALPFSYQSAALTVIKQLQKDYFSVSWEPLVSDNAQTYLYEDVAERLKGLAEKVPKEYSAIHENIADALKILLNEQTAEVYIIPKSIDKLISDIKVEVEKMPKQSDGFWKNTREQALQIISEIQEDYQLKVEKPPSPQVTPKWGSKF